MGVSDVVMGSSADKDNRHREIMCRHRDCKLRQFPGPVRGDTAAISLSGSPFRIPGYFFWLGSPVG